MIALGPVWLTDSVKQWLQSQGLFWQVILFGKAVCDLKSKEFSMLFSLKPRSIFSHIYWGTFKYFSMTCVYLLAGTCSMNGYPYMDAIE